MSVASMSRLGASITMHRHAPTLGGSHADTHGHAVAALPTPQPRLPCNQQQRPRRRDWGEFLVNDGGNDDAPDRAAHGSPPAASAPGEWAALLSKNVSGGPTPTGAHARDPARAGAACQGGTLLGSNGERTPGGVALRGGHAGALPAQVAAAATASPPLQAPLPQHPQPQQPTQPRCDWAAFLGDGGSCGGGVPGGATRRPGAPGHRDGGCAAGVPSPVAWEDLLAAAPRVAAAAAQATAPAPEPAARAALAGRWPQLSAADAGAAVQATPAAQKAAGAPPPDRGAPAGIALGAAARKLEPLDAPRSAAGAPGGVSAAPEPKGSAGHPVGASAALKPKASTSHPVGASNMRVAVGSEGRVPRARLGWAAKAPAPLVDRGASHHEDRSDGSDAGDGDSDAPNFDLLPAGACSQLALTAASAAGGRVSRPNRPQQPAAAGAVPAGATRALAVPETQHLPPSHALGPQKSPWEGSVPAEQQPAEGQGRSGPAACLDPPVKAVATGALAAPKQCSACDGNGGDGKEDDDDDGDGDDVLSFLSLR
eukprot:364240-Chlamydomonas_euryale.AAC.8